MTAFGLSILDWIIVGIFFISFVTAFINGFFVEVFSIVGLVAGLLIAGIYYTQLEPWIYRFLHSVPAAEATSFLLIAVGVLIVAGIIGRLLRLVLRKVGLGWADRLLGLVFGAVKGCFLATVLAMAVTAFFPDRSWVAQSKLLPYFVGAAHQGSDIVPNSLGERIRHGVRVFHRESPAGHPSGGMVTF
jgi:membrane protein required for colicin V production